MKVEQKPSASLVKIPEVQISSAGSCTYGTSAAPREREKRVVWSIMENTLVLNGFDPGVSTIRKTHKGRST